MKEQKVFAYFFFLFLFFSVGTLNAQLKVNSSGNIGFGTDPVSSYKLTSSGSYFLNGYLGIGTAPSTSYRLKLVGNSYFSSSKMVIDGNTTSEPAFALTGRNAYPGMFLNTNYPYSCEYLLVVEGNACVNSLYEDSDIRLKNNIVELDGKQMLSKIANLSGNKYAFKSNAELESMYANMPNKENVYSHKPKNLPVGDRYGLIAQEIEKEFPELVKTDPVSSLKSVNYEGMIPILLESIKEQQKMILQLQNKLNINNDQPSNEPVKAPSKNNLSNADNSEISQNTLYQNIPNPFSQSTTIGYYLKENIQNAKIGIYNMNGTQLRSITVQGVGNGKVVIDAKELKAGMYMYSLIVDGSLIDTKRMVLTD